MKKWYHIFIVAAVSVSLLLCSVIPVGAAKAVQYKGSTWYEVNYFDVVSFQFGGDEIRNYGYVSLPYSNNYFGDTPPAATACILYPGGSNGGDGEIEVPAGYYIDIDFQFYITYKTSSAASWVTLPKKYISAGVSYNYFDPELNNYQVGDFKLDVTQVKGSDNRTYNYGTKLFSNNTGKTVYVNSFFGGSASSLPSAYAYYVQATRVRYRVLSPSQVTIENQNANTDKLVSEIGNSADQITGGWTPDPQAPAGSGTVNDYSDLESGMLNNAADGVGQANDLFNSLGSKLEMYSGSFLAISRFIDVFTGDVPILGILLWVSLTIGLFGFIFNGVSSLVSKFSKSRKGR